MCTRKGRSKGGINAKFHPSCLRADVMHKALLEHFINIVSLLPGSASVMYKVHRLTEKLTKHKAEAMKKKKAVS